MAEIHPDILAFWQDEPQKVGTAEELRQLEADLGTTLPDSFKEYQSEIGYKRIYFKNEKYKWGEMEAGIHAIYDMGAQDVERPIVFSYFYSIEGIRNNQQDFASSMKLADIGAQIPPGMLTVGSAMGKTQGQVLLNLSDENHGTVWYWERADETWGLNGNDKLGFLGKDVFDVISRLVPYEG